MKKISKTVILLFSIILLCSCDNKEYTVTEISGQELVKTLFIKDDPTSSIVFGICSKNSPDYEKFINEYKTLAKETHLDLFFIDSDRLDIPSAMALGDTFDISGDICSYGAYINQTEIFMKDYTNYQTMVNDHRAIGYKPNIKKNTDKEVDEAINKAKKELEEGNVGVSINHLYSVYPNKKAKEFYDNNNIYKIINHWEYYDFEDMTKLTKMHYYTMLFYIKLDSLLYLTEKGTFGEYEKPNDTKDYHKYYYKIKDNIIYCSDTPKGKKVPRFEIIRLNDYELHIKDLKTKKILEYGRRD